MTSESIAQFINKVEWVAEYTTDEYMAGELRSALTKLYRGTNENE